MVFIITSFVNKIVILNAFSFHIKKITIHPTTPTLLTLPPVTIVLYVLLDAFFSYTQLLRKICPMPPTPLWQPLSYTFLFFFDFFCHSIPPSSSPIPKSNARTHTNISFYNIYTCSPKCTYTRYILLNAIRNTLMCKGRQKYFSLLSAGEVLVQ